jgi:hypothetical protein
VTSPAFERVLKATHYLSDDGTPAPGLVRSIDNAPPRFRSVLANDRVGLNADAVFTAQGTPAAIFKDSGTQAPSDDNIHFWHEAAWNIGVAPLLWVITPTDVHLYDCYSSPQKSLGQMEGTPLDRFSLIAEGGLQPLDAMCGRLATETGAFWSSQIGSRIDRRRRVDRELLAEIQALENQLVLIPPARPVAAPEDPTAARDFAQRLIGRCIFTSYLIDRGLAQQFLPMTLPQSLGDIFADTDRTYELFEWLRATFNGDLFPMDDPGAERERLGSAHLALLRDFVEGRSLVPENSGQGRLFRFRFEAIQVDLISSIYQQFARSAAGDMANQQGLHFTPIELVHLVLDPVFEGLPATARVIDPTCGSGAFLVEAFRRLVWKNSGGGPATRALVREILYNRLFGIDINRSALGIAAFSLYLAALEFDDDPVTQIADLKFDHLIGTTLFEANTIGNDLPGAVLEQPFDAVVGNPPWTFDGRRPKRIDDETARPRRSPDQAFLHVAAVLAGNAGRVGMVMKASPFFSNDENAVEARKVILTKLSPVGIVNLSALRKEGLFPDSTGPALLLFARCALMARDQQLIVGSVPWTPDFRRNGVFQVGPAELRAVSLSRVLQTTSFLKAVTFGTIRDGWLIERLARDFPSLEEVLAQGGLVRLEGRGQGFQVRGRHNAPPREYTKLRVLTVASYEPFRVAASRLEDFRHKTLHRSRSMGIFKGPLLICPKGCSAAAAEQGRYSATVSDSDLLYPESFYGISFAGRNSRWAYMLSAVLNSSLTAFQLLFGGSSWGLERPTVEPNDLLALRVPDLAALGPDDLDTVMAAEAAAAAEPHSRDRLEALDASVFALYGLEPDEALLARESVARARSFLFERRRGDAILPPTDGCLDAYASTVIEVVDRYLRARAQRHLEASVYSQLQLRSEWHGGSPDLTAVRFSMGPGAPSGVRVINDGESAAFRDLVELLQDRLQSTQPPYLNERRQLRVYLGRDLLILKPNEARYWSRVAGLNDADAILADDWIGTQHDVSVRA